VFLALLSLSLSLLSLSSLLQVENERSLALRKIREEHKDKQVLLAWGSTRHNAWKKLQEREAKINELKAQKEKKENNNNEESGYNGDGKFSDPASGGFSDKKVAKKSSGPDATDWTVCVLFVLCLSVCSVCSLCLCVSVSVFVLSVCLSVLYLSVFFLSVLFGLFVLSPHLSSHPSSFSLLSPPLSSFFTGCFQQQNFRLWWRRQQQSFETQRCRYRGNCTCYICWWIFGSECRDSYS
jgi:hypothetical protein